MPPTEHWLAEHEDRRAELQQIQGVFWNHDGNLKRPFVRLRSKKLSNGYFNGGKLCEIPIALDDFATELADELFARAPGIQIDRVVAPAMGAITLGHSVASMAAQRQHAPVFFSYAEKDGDGFIFRRNPPQDGERLLLVEDTITTGGSLLKVRDAALKIAKVEILPFTVALCNRSGKNDLDGMEIVSLVTADFSTWDEGGNPFTPDGKELVPPVEDVKQNWDRLTMDYP